MLQNGRLVRLAVRHTERHLTLGPSSRSSPRVPPALGADAWSSDIRPHIRHPPSVDPSAWLIANRQAATAELFEFLRIPSISARSEHQADVAGGRVAGREIRAG
jgi:hypothetical protein